MAEILASLDDINGNLDQNVVEADDTNTALIQVSVARVIRGYLSRVLPISTMLAWDTPGNTPEIIREIAGKLIAAQHYFVEISSQSAEISDTHYAQRLYDQAMAMLNQILAGDIVIDDVIIVDDTSSISLSDGFPVDDTDRAFTMGMNL